MLSSYYLADTVFVYINSACGFYSSRVIHRHILLSNIVSVALIIDIFSGKNVDLKING